uniref:EF-hand domain-containing protein n=1 Tax=Zooxanthella nutricula TaxID=1333877 RepID=A0A7S2M1D5_9DINO
MDTDGSGTVDADELREKLGSLGVQMSLSEASDAIRRAQPDGGGELSIDGFIDLMEAQLVGARRRESEAARQKVGLERDRSDLEARTSCWICESWQPVEIAYEGEAIAVWAFTSLDGYQRATRLTKDVDGKFSCQRMLPPDQICVVLQVDHGTALVAGLETARLPEPVTLKLRQAEELPAPGGPAPTTAEVSEVSVVQLGGGGRKPKPGAAAAPAPRRAVVIDDPSSPGGICVKPRITETEFKAKKRREPWCFEKSLFAAWRFETPRVYSAAFSADWGHMKVHKFMKEKADQDQIADAFKAHYGEFARIYRRCAATSSDRSTTMGVSMATCLELMASASVLDDQFCKMADVDTMFIAARVREKGADKRPLAIKVGDMLLRFQFAEFLVRIAVARFWKTKEVDTLAQAVDRLFACLTAQLGPAVADLQEFLQAFHTEACDRVLRARESALGVAFRCHSGRWAKPGETRMMCCREFEGVLGTADAFNERFLARDVPYAFQLGLQLYQDELFDLDFAQMTFLEFLHGLGAAAHLRADAEPLAVRLGCIVDRLVQCEGLNNVLRGLK